MNKKKFDVDSCDIISKGISANYKQSYRIYYPSEMNHPRNNSILFCTEEYWKSDYFSKLLLIKESIIILDEKIRVDTAELKKNNILIMNEAPKFLYIKLLNAALGCERNSRKYKLLDNNIVIGENVGIGSNTIIEPGVFLDHGIEIGDNCTIKVGVQIRSNVTIGNNCVIGENCIIGTTGLGISTDRNGKHHRIPHIGGVVIEDEVELGALNTVASGTIHPTIIKKYVITGERNQISHNCYIGEGTIISGNVVITGGVSVGKEVWLGPNCSIINGVVIGNFAQIAIGSVVYDEVEEGTVIMGNPARVFSKRSQESIKKREIVPNMHFRKR